MLQRLVPVRSKANSDLVAFVTDVASSPEQADGVSTTYERRTKIMEHVRSPCMMRFTPRVFCSGGRVSRKLHHVTPS